MNSSLKELRLRLGWTHSEMARQIGCDVRFVRQWEADGSCPQEVFNQKIQRLVTGADEHAWRLSQAPLAEKAMWEQGLSQLRLPHAG